MNPTPLAADPLAAGNPFALERVPRGGAAPIDVSAIHDRPFQRLVELATAARRDDMGVGVTLWGEAGAGKSHLLRRLERWAIESEQGAFAAPASLLVPPEEIPRTVMHDTVAVLAACPPGQWHESLLFRAVERVVIDAVRAHGENRPTVGRACERYHEAVAAWAGTVPGLTADDPLFRVLFRFFWSGVLARSRGEDDEAAPVVLRWLSGDDLDPAEASALDLRPREASPTGAAVLRAVAVLARFMRRIDRTLILAFDQIHTLPPAQVSALTRFLHELLDTAGNVLLVTAEVQDELVRLVEERRISPASWDRIGQHRIDLPRLPPELGRQLVDARLRAYLEPFRSQPEVVDAITRDPLYPLGAAWWADRFKDVVELRPRRYLQLARERWDELRTAPPPAPVAPGPDPRVAEIVAAPHKLPPNADHLVGLVRALLSKVLHRPGGARVEGVEIPSKATAYDGRVTVHSGPQRRERTVGFVVVVTGSANSATATLRRLAEDSNPPDLVLLVSDARMPLPLGDQPTARGREYLAQLEKRGPDGFQRIDLSVGQLAELAAMAEAQAADPDAVGIHVRAGRYHGHALLGLMLSDEPA